MNDDSNLRCPVLRLHVLALLLTATVSGSFAAPTLQRALPAAVQPGATTQIAFLGKDLKDITRLWTSFPAQTEFVDQESDAGRVTFRLTLPSEISPGVGAVRVYGAKGVSHAMLILIDELPSVAEGEGNHTRDRAMEISVPGAVDGLSESLGLDYFSMRVAKGQRLSIDVLAQRLGSRMDPVVRLLDAQGGELAYMDDEPGIGPDCRFRHTFAESGVHFLEVRDVRYQGGRDYHYRLRLGDFPLATLPYPFTVPPGEPASVIFLGRDGTESSGVMAVELPAEGGGRCIPVAGAGDAVRSYAILRSRELPRWLEIEPNETREQAVSFTLPAMLYGRLETPKDRDVYRFEGAKGLRVVAKAETRSAGSPCDVSMRLQRADGSLVAESKMKDGDDGMIDHKLSESGSYLLVVEELNVQGGPNYAYGIAVTRFEPGFELSVESDRVTAKPGDEFSLIVTLDRKEYDGPVTLAVEGVGEGVVLENEAVLEKKNETTLKVRMPETWEPKSLEHFTITGSAQIGERTFQARASILPALAATFPQTRDFPPELDHQIALWQSGRP